MGGSGIRKKVKNFTKLFFTTNNREIKKNCKKLKNRYDSIVKFRKNRTIDENVICEALKKNDIKENCIECIKKAKIFWCNSECYAEKDIEVLFKNISNNNQDIKTNLNDLTKKFIELLGDTVNLEENLQENDCLDKIGECLDKMEKIQKVIDKIQETTKSVEDKLDKNEGGVIMSKNDSTNIDVSHLVKKYNEFVDNVKKYPDRVCSVFSEHKDYKFIAQLIKKKDGKWKVSGTNETDAKKYHEFEECKCGKNSDFDELKEKLALFLGKEKVKDKDEQEIKNIINELNIIMYNKVLNETERIQNLLVEKYNKFIESHNKFVEGKDSVTINKLVLPDGYPECWNKEGENFSESVNVNNNDTFYRVLSNFKEKIEEWLNKDIGKGENGDYEYLNKALDELTDLQKKLEAEKEKLNKMYTDCVENFEKCVDSWNKVTDGITLDAKIKKLKKLGVLKAEELKYTNEFEKFNDNNEEPFETNVKNLVSNINTYLKGNHVIDTEKLNVKEMLQLALQETGTWLTNLCEIIVHSEKQEGLGTKFSRYEEYKELFKEIVSKYKNLKGDPGIVEYFNYLERGQLAWVPAVFSQENPNVKDGYTYRLPSSGKISRKLFTDKENDLDSAIGALKKTLEAIDNYKRLKIDKDSVVAKYTEKFNKLWPKFEEVVENHDNLLHELYDNKKLQEDDILRISKNALGISDKDDLKGKESFIKFLVIPSYDKVEREDHPVVKVKNIWDNVRNPQDELNFIRKVAGMISNVFTMVDDHVMVKYLTDLDTSYTLPMKNQNEYDEEAVSKLLEDLVKLFNRALKKLESNQKKLEIAFEIAFKDGDDKVKAVFVVCVKKFNDLMDLVEKFLDSKVIKQKEEEKQKIERSLLAERGIVYKDEDSLKKFTVDSNKDLKQDVNKFIEKIGEVFFGGTICEIQANDSGETIIQKLEEMKKIINNRKKKFDDASGKEMIEQGQDSDLNKAFDKALKKNKSLKSRTKKGVKNIARTLRSKLLGKEKVVKKAFQQVEKENVIKKAFQQVGKYFVTDTADSKGKKLFTGKGLKQAIGGEVKRICPKWYETLKICLSDNVMKNIKLSEYTNNGIRKVCDNEERDAKIKKAKSLAILLISLCGLCDKEGRCYVQAAMDGLTGTSGFKDLNVGGTIELYLGAAANILDKEMKKNNGELKPQGKIRMIIEPQSLNSILDKFKNTGGK